MNKKAPNPAHLLVRPSSRLKPALAVVWFLCFLPCLAISARAPAPPPAPELLNVFPPEPAAKEAPAETPKSVPAETPPPAAADSSAQNVIAATPVQAPAPQAVLPQPAAETGYYFESLLRPSLTDILVALFTLAVVLFAWRLSAVNTRFAATSQAQLDTNRRAVEASERAADAAKRSADAAEKSAVVLQDTAARQLRPYVSVKEFLQGPVKDENSYLHGWVFQVVWQNSGATPTNGFRYWAALRQFDNGIPADFDFAPPALADFAGGELGPGATVTSGTLFMGQQDVAQLQGGTRKAVLYGKAEYNDVVRQDVKHETRFSVEVMLVSDASGAHATPFSFSYHPRHNATT
jgi:hypothetical protein